jgi:SAM-dependent methyltransferase
MTLQALGNLSVAAKKSSTKNHEKLARFYDAALGDRAQMASYIRSLIRQHQPKAKTLLELACGTGAILKSLAKYYDVVGLDLSPQMLAIARKKLPHLRFYRDDMVRFDLGTRFDVIICVFDSLNHMLKFADWQKIFRNAARHLEPNGLFLFDINTEAKLKRLISAPTWVNKFGRNLELIKVTDSGRGIANWNVRVFEYQSGNRFKLFEENLKQISFPVEQVRDALRTQFTNVKVIDELGRKPPLNRAGYILRASNNVFPRVKGLQPFMPATAARLQESVFGEKPLKRGAPLFPRLKP